MTFDKMSDEAPEERESLFQLMVSEDFTVAWPREGVPGAWSVDKKKGRLRWGLEGGITFSASLPVKPQLLEVP